MPGEFERLVRDYVPALVGPFLTQNILEVPPNQRPYAWGIDDWTDLWEDLIDTIRQSEEQASDPFYAYHFLGPMFFVKKAESENLRVLDGQQRLATIDIILTVISDIARYFRQTGHLSAVGEEIPGRVPGYLQARVRGTPAFRLVLGKDNRTFFESLLAPVQYGQTPPPVPSLKLTSLREESKSSASNESILKCYKFFLEEITKKLASQNHVDVPRGRIAPETIAAVLLANPEGCEHFLKSILENITERFYILRAIVPSPEVMYQMFETLNQRGEKLVVADLFKNLLLDRFENRLGEERIQNLWSDLTDVVGDYIGDFLRHYWLSNHKFVRVNKLFRAIRDEIHGLDDVQQFTEFMRGLTDEARIYSALRTPADDRWRTHEETRQLLSELDYLGFRQGLPLLLAVYVKYAGSEPQKFDKLLKSYVNLVVRSYTILEGNPSEFEEDYSSWAREIRHAGRRVEDVMTKIRDVTPGNEDVTTGLVGMNGVSPKVGRYIITKINDAIETNPLRRTWNNRPTVEHVIPQSPEDWWNNFLTRKNLKHKTLVERLGNLTILSLGDNRELGNMPYTEKRPRYLATNLPINSGTFTGSAFDEFTDLAIRAREKIFADFIVKLGLWS